MDPGKEEVQSGTAHVDVHSSDLLKNQELMTDAFDGENHEHEQGVWAAAKSHPWACLWAFIMCFTIVSPLSESRDSSVAERSFLPVPAPRISASSDLPHISHMIIFWFCVNPKQTGLG